MPTREKRLESARQNPKTVGFDALCRILQDHGFVIRKGKGSHRIASLPGTALRITFPQKNPMKNVYVDRALELIEEVVALAQPEIE